MPIPNWKAACPALRLSSQTDSPNEDYLLTQKSRHTQPWACWLYLVVPFSRNWTALRATEEAKQVMIRHHHEVFRVPFTGGAINIDTPEDHEQFRTIEHSCVASQALGQMEFFQGR